MSLFENPICRKCMHFTPYDPENPTDSYSCLIVKKYVHPDDNYYDHFNLPWKPDGYVKLRKRKEEESAYCNTREIIRRLING